MSRPTEPPPPAAVVANKHDEGERNGLDIAIQVGRYLEEQRSQQGFLPDPARSCPSQSQKWARATAKSQAIRITVTQGRRQVSPISPFRHVGIAYRSIAPPYQLDMQRGQLRPYIGRPCASSAEEHITSYQSCNRPFSPTRVRPQMTKKFTSGIGRYSHAGRGR